MLCRINPQKLCCAGKVLGGGGCPGEGGLLTHPDEWRRPIAPYLHLQPPRSGQGGLQRLYELMGGQICGGAVSPLPPSTLLALGDLFARQQFFARLSGGSVCPRHARAECQSLSCAWAAGGRESGRGADGPMIFVSSFG